MDSRHAFGERGAGFRLRRDVGKRYHPGGNPGENLKSISHRCYLEVAFVWELTKETIVLPLVASRAVRGHSMPSPRPVGNPNSFSNPPATYGVTSELP